MLKILGYDGRARNTLPQVPNSSSSMPLTPIIGCSSQALQRTWIPETTNGGQLRKQPHHSACQGRIVTCEEHAYLQPYLGRLLAFNPVPVLASQKRSASARQGPTTCSSLSFDILRGVPDSLPIHLGETMKLNAYLIVASRVSIVDNYRRLQSGCQDSSSSPNVDSFSPLFPSSNLPLGKRPLTFPCSIIEFTEGTSDHGEYEHHAQ